MVEEPIKTYEVPGIGRVSLVYDKDNLRHGPYYGKTENYGKIAKNSHSYCEANMMLKGFIEGLLKKREKDEEARESQEIISRNNIEQKLKPFEINLGSDRK